MKSRDGSLVVFPGTFLGRSKGRWVETVLEGGLKLPLGGINSVDGAGLGRRMGLDVVFCFAGSLMIDSFGSNFDWDLGMMGRT
jgi:hypothetical protein